MVVIIPIVEVYILIDPSKMLVGLYGDISIDRRATFWTDIPSYSNSLRRVV